MQPQIIARPGFKIIGIEVRTSNPEELSGKGKIGQTWQKFYSENILSQIPGKRGDAVLAAYTDYESDVNGAYSLIIGSEVDSLADIPTGLVGREIPAAKYAVFTSARGSIPGIIIDVWKRIWEYKGAARLYQTDFEVYGQESRDPNNAQVEVYVSVR
jgi:predicted transcriptional regulator YdeE